MKRSLVIAHIHTEPQSNVSNLKGEIAKFLEGRRECTSKHLYLRSSFRSILEEAIGGKIRPDNVEFCRSDEPTDGSAQNETTEIDSFFDYSKPAEVWRGDNVISVDVTRVSMLQAMEQSPTDTWDASKLRHFVAHDGLLPATSRNITQSKNWWDRPLWAWERDELVLAHGAMLAVEMMEELNPILSSSQNVKVTVSHTKDVPKIPTSGDWSYRIALFEEVNDRDYDKKEEKIGDICPTGSSGPLVSSADDRINSPMCENDQNDSNQDCENEQQIGAEATMSEGIDLDSNLLSASNQDERQCKLASPGANESLVNIPITLSQEDSIATLEPKGNMKHASEPRLETAIDSGLLSSSSIGESSRLPPTSPTNARKSLAVTPVNRNDHPLTESHDCIANHESGDEFSHSENTDSLQKDGMNTLVSTPDEAGESAEVEIPLSTPVQQVKLQSATVSPNHTQEAEEEYKVSSTELSEVRLNGSEDLSKSPQFDSQGIDLSMLSQIPQEHRSEARLALAVNQPRRPRKRFRPPKDSHLYKWLSSSSSKSSKIPRTENPLVEDKKRPNSIKDFFPTT